QCCKATGPVGPFPDPRDIGPSKRLSCQGTASSRRKVRLHLQDGTAALLAVLRRSGGSRKHRSAHYCRSLPRERTALVLIIVRLPPWECQLHPRCTGADRPSQLTADLCTDRPYAALRRFRPVTVLLSPSRRARQHACFVHEGEIGMESCHAVEDGLVDSVVLYCCCVCRHDCGIVAFSDILAVRTMAASVLDGDHGGQRHHRQGRALPSCTWPSAGSGQSGGSYSARVRTPHRVLPGLSANGY